MADTIGNRGRGGRATVAGMTAAPVEAAGYGRGATETTVRNVTQVMNVPADKVRWGPIWAGLLAAFSTLLALSLLGLAVGASAVNASATAGGGVNQNAGQYSALWAGISVILSFLVGGYVAGRTAAVRERGWAGLNGGLVFLLALPILLWLATQGLGALIGNAGGIANGLGVNWASSARPPPGRPRASRRRRRSRRRTRRATRPGAPCLGCSWATPPPCSAASSGARTRPSRGELRRG